MAEMKWKTKSDLELEAQEAIKQEWRVRRDNECFPIINRGELWYSELTKEQTIELKIWYKAWKDITKTLVEPKKPTWL